jgi:hypothetical protein
MPLKVESIGTVEVSVEHPFGFIGLEDGWAVPPSFTITARFAEAPIPNTVEVDVVVEEGARPRASRVSISLDSGSVSSTTLRQIPVRELVAAGLFQVVAKVESNAAGTHKIAPPKDDDVEEVREVVKRAVGWLS